MSAGVYDIGGASTVMEKLANNLVENGHDVTIGALQFKRLPPKGIYNVDAIPVTNVLKLRKFLEKFDVIHNHHPLTNYLAFFSNKPFIYHYHGAPDFGSGCLYRLSMLFSIKLFKHRFDAVIAVSEAGREDFEKCFSFNKVCVIYNGVDTRLFKPEPDERFRKGKPQFLFVGNLYDYKKVDELIFALKQLVRIYPKAHLQIVGDGVTQSKLKNLANKLNVNSNISFIGVVPHNEIISYYTSCDLYVTASRCEQLPLPLVEAWACGKPVVASSIRSHEELLFASKAGKIFKVGDVQDLCSAIKTVYADKDKFRCNAIQFAKKHDWSNVADDVLKIYAQAMRK